MHQSDPFAYHIIASEAEPATQALCGKGSSVDPLKKDVANFIRLSDLFDGRKWMAYPLCDVCRKMARIQTNDGLAALPRPTMLRIPCLIAGNSLDVEISTEECWVDVSNGSGITVQPINTEALEKHAKRERHSAVLKILREGSFRPEAMICVGDRGLYTQLSAEEVVRMIEDARR